MYHQFNIQQLYVLPTQCIYVFCIYLRTKSDLCHLHHKLIGFYNRDEKCLLRGTNCVFKYSSLHFAFKGLIDSQTMLNGVNEFLPVLPTFLELSGWNCV